MKAHLLHTLTEDARSVLNNALEQVEVAYGPVVERETEVIVGGRPTKEQLEACGTELRALVVPFAGLPQETRQLILEWERSIDVYNLHHNAAMVAETAVALMMAAAKWIVPMDKALRAMDWRPRYQPDPAVTLAGSRVLVLGFGAIGKRITRLCHGLGMDVIATRQSIEQPVDDVGCRVYPAAMLRTLLPQAQRLIVALPETDATRGLLGKKELALLPPNAILVNIARASIVDEDALFEALDEGALHSAALDVWYAYPTRDVSTRAHTPPARRPFHRLDNVIMSPHRSGHGEGIERLRMEQLARVLNALAQGVDAPNLVHVARGY